MKGQFHSGFDKLVDCGDFVTFGYEFFSELKIRYISRQAPENDFECCFFET